MRIGEIKRKTAETDIVVKVNIDGSGKRDIKTGVGFFDHVLESFTKHGLFDIDAFCKGDTWVDAHHSVEDVGIALGEAFLAAMGDKKGIRRFAHSILPMDEALVMASVDISGRPYIAYDIDFRDPTTGGFDACLLEEFLRAFAFGAKVTLHVKKLAGTNTHHIIECAMKAVARAMMDALTIDPRVTGVPSTKGSL